MQINSVDTRDSIFSPSVARGFESQPIRQTSFAGIISECSEMQKIFSVVEKVAKTNSTVLVLGESGTGKELIARALHKFSGRTGRLVPVNCGAIPEDILESELFGHEKGSFTGAVSSRIGRFQMADGGTIFLDEIGEMSPKLQVKLLRVLQERKVEPVGSTRTLDVDVRVVAATNKDLREEVKAGRFREDLYYRLQVVPVELPALRNRGGDVKLLSEYFLKRACGNIQRSPIAISSEVANRFAAYNWPGNIRELENLMERLAILGDSDTLQLSDLPEHLQGPSQAPVLMQTVDEIPGDGVDFNQLVDQFETRLITMALARTNGNKKAAARLLSLNRTTLVEKIKKKEIERKIGFPLSDGNEPTVQAWQS
jgi:transcriptional regulator with GAF, ATPase, and Fis domain